MYAIRGFNRPLPLFDGQFGQGVGEGLPKQASDVACALILKAIPEREAIADQNGIGVLSSNAKIIQ